MSLVAGAYPCYFADPDDNSEFMSILGSDRKFGALELPIRGLNDPLIWPDGAPETWGAVITQIPGTMAQLNADPSFGLASKSERGRRAAIDFTRHTFERCHALAADGHPVMAVELHSAPRGACSPDALSASLSAIAEWEWGDTILAVEHCDAPRPGIPPQKGFLELAEEIDVIRGLNGIGPRVGITINWARSVIETRSVEAGQAHLIQARKAGVLAGMMFSSAASQETSFGPPWTDAHPAPLGCDGTPDSSVLTPEIIAICVASLPADIGYIGFKVGFDGLDTPTERAAAWHHLGSLVSAAEETR